MRSFLISILLLFLGVQYSVADVAISSQETPWSELAPSQDALEEGAVYILISLNDYVDFDLKNLKTASTDIKTDLDKKSCLKYEDVIQFSAPCFNYLREEHNDVFKELVENFVAFYDLETPSYQVKMPSAEYPFLKINDVLLRLKTKFDDATAELDPTSLLSPLVYESLWTVPTNQANCFGTAYAAITPNAPLKYRDFLWDTKNPPGYDLFTMDDDLVFGDMIEFEIPGDGHATIYLGTDQEGDDIVLTKNGYMPSVIQVMKYKDVYDLYNQYGITQVNVWRYNHALLNNYVSVNPNYVEDSNPLAHFRSKAPGIALDDFLLRDLGRKFNKWVKK